MMSTNLIDFLIDRIGGEKSIDEDGLLLTITTSERRRT